MSGVQRERGVAKASHHLPLLSARLRPVARRHVGDRGIALPRNGLRPPHCHAPRSDTAWAIDAQGSEEDEAPVVVVGGKVRPEKDAGGAVDIALPMERRARSRGEAANRVDLDRSIPFPRDRLGYRLTKRAFDIVFSLLMLIILLPVLLLVALAIYLDDPKGGVIFVQERCGRDGKIFKFLKFRSMVVDAEERLEALRDFNEMDGPVFKIRDDPRVTRFGCFIRRTSIDELPQLINIIQGDMSLVGPRPPLPEEVAQYGPYEMQRLLVKPGLTCYWQARGRNEIKFHQWMEMDMKYVYHHNLWIDIKLLLLTVRSVVTGKGAM